MNIKRRKSWQLSENEVTSERDYLNRRKFMLAGGAALLAAGGTVQALQGTRSERERTIKPLDHVKNTSYTVERELTPEDAVTKYNNFYEFGTGKGDPAVNAWRLQVDPWNVSIEGEVDKPGTYAFEDLVDFKALEERIYRLRCVEAWSMVVPWIGVPLASLINKVEPTADAKYVIFETLYDTQQMPGTRWQHVIDWPYTEALRIDEAMNELAFMVVGLYGKEIPNQNGAPMRLILPWKYGFKSIKSIVTMRFVKEMPVTSWMKTGPDEYGFFANVNPNVRHPRWSQATERVIGEFGRRPTLMFNGYEEQVADLYKGMDLRRFF